MRPADRLFQIVLLLGRSRVVTAQALAEHLEVSVRTIYRDIADLIGSGVPVDGEAGVGYRLRPGYQVPPMMFDHDELQALVFGAAVAAQWGDDQIAAAADRILSKVDAVLPKHLRPALASQALVVPEIAGMQTAQTTAQLGDVRRAVNQRKKLQLDYSDARGKTTERVVWPLTLAYWGNSWTVGAWCELRAAFRSFRIDRVRQTRVLITRYPDQSGRRLADYLNSVD